jgi:hypothetical protein
MCSFKHPMGRSNTTEGLDIFTLEQLLMQRFWLKYYITNNRSFFTPSKF